MAFVVPRDFEYYYQKGFEAIEQGNNAAAIYYLDSAIILEPQADTAFSLLAYSYYNLGKIDEAINQSNKALAINPKNPFAYFYRGISKALINVDSDSLFKIIRKHKKIVLGFPITFGIDTISLHLEAISTKECMIIWKL